VCKKLRTTFRNIIGGTDYPTHMAPRVVTKLSVRLFISQTARSVRPMEEQPRGLDTIANLSLYGGPSYGYHKPAIGERGMGGAHEYVWYSPISSGVLRSLNTDRTTGLFLFGCFHPSSKSFLTEGEIGGQYRCFPRIENIESPCLYSGSSCFNAFNLRFFFKDDPNIMGVTRGGDKSKGYEVEVAPN